MAGPAPESSSHEYRQKGFFPHLLLLANRTRVMFREGLYTVPSEETFLAIGQRLYPEYPETVAQFSDCMYYQSRTSEEVERLDLHLALEGSDLDVLNWLRAHYFDGDDFFETQQEKLQLGTEEGNGDLPQRQQSTSSESSFTGCVDELTDTEDSGADHMMEIQQQQESSVRRRHQTSVG